MDIHPSRGAGGLPPPPAPTARDANPWKFSDTARVTAPREPTGYERLLAELERSQAGQESDGKPAALPEPAGPGPEPRTKREPAFAKIFPLIILLIMFASFAREMIEAGGDDRPRLLFIVAVLLVAVVVTVFLALRMVRRRRPRR